jgi:DNA-binding transcriptional regulator of glucitol operon
MAAEPPGLRTGLTRALCIVVFVVMLAALLYAAWIGVSNYSRIHV